jgi:hypothetical protein
MKVLCFALFACAFNLLIGYVGLLSFGHAACSSAWRLCHGHAAKVWGFTPELGILFGGLVGAGSGSSSAAIAIRRQGIYFAMITLALAQMVYFFCLQAPFTGGEDGIQGVPRGACSACSRWQRPHAVLRRAGDLPRRLPLHLPHRPLALRPGAEGDPRERAARDLARLRATATSSWPSCCRPALAGWPGAPRPSCWASPR